MAENAYHLYITVDGGDGTNTTSPIAKQKNGGSNNGADVGGLTRKTAVVAAYSVVEPFINGTMQIIQNDVKTNYANQDLEQRIGIVMNGAKGLIDTGVSALAGGGIASALGLSSGVGALVVVAAKAVQFATNLIVRQNEINNNIKVENEQLNILRGRMGIQFNRSRGGE